MKIRVFLLLFLLQGVLMGASLKEIEIQKSQVDVVYEQGEYIPIVSIQLVFRNAGHLSSHIDGLADMSAKLLNEGTSKLGSVGYATTLDEKAVDISAGVGRESFVLEVSSLKSEFPYAVEKLIELIKDPNYTQDALEQIKYQKLGWLMQKKSDFSYIASTNLRKVLFPNTPLGSAYDGTQKSIKGLGLEDIKRFITEHLGYNNVIAVVGGDISFEETKNYLSKILSLFPKVKKEVTPTFNASNKEETLVTQEPTEQAYIFFGAPFNFSYKEKNQHLAKIAEYLLGGAGFGSRLMEEIRVKRGLTYGVYASLKRTKSASYLSGYLQTKLSTQEEAKDLIKEVVARFIKEGITQQELDDTKLFLLGSEPLHTETLSQRLHRAYNDFYYERALNFSVEQLKKIEGVTLSEVNDFIKSHEELMQLSFSIVTK